MVPFSTARHPAPEAATQLQTITPQSYFHDGMIDLSVFYPKVLGIIKIFFGKIEMSLKSFFSAAVFILELCHAGHFCRFSLLWWSHGH